MISMFSWMWGGSESTPTPPSSPVPTREEPPPLYDCQIDLSDLFILSDKVHSIRVVVRVYFDKSRVNFGLAESALFRTSMQEVHGSVRCNEIVRNEHKVVFAMVIRYSGGVVDRDSKRGGCVQYLPHRVKAAVRLSPTVVGMDTVTPSDISSEVHSVCWSG